MNAPLRTGLLTLGTLALTLTACDATLLTDESAGNSVLTPTASVAGHAGRHKALGSGYADFVLSDGSEGENRYWTNAHRDPDGRLRGSWRADVYIDFGNFIFDFEVTYTVDCLEVDPATREAWVEGVVIEANDPDFLGRRAVLYVQDGGPRGDDFHAITPLNDLDVTCADRPEPDFRERVERGNYVVR